MLTLEQTWFKAPLSSNLTEDEDFSSHAITSKGQTEADIKEKNNNSVANYFISSS
jgi:hypothetical protein